MRRQVVSLFLVLIALAAQAFAQSGRIAFVDTLAFSHPVSGITRLVRAHAIVEREFAPRRAELIELYNRLQQQQRKFSFFGPIPTDPEPMTPERRKELRSQAETLKLDFERKQNEIESAHDARSKEITAPIYEDIRNSLESFAK